MNDTQAKVASSLALALAEIDAGGQPSQSRIYEVDGLLFRVDATRPTAAAEALRAGAWQEFCLSGVEVQALLGARELSAQEARLIEYIAPSRSPRSC